MHKQHRHSRWSIVKFKNIYSDAEVKCHNSRREIKWSSIKWNKKNKRYGRRYTQQFTSQFSSKQSEICFGKSKYVHFCVRNETSCIWFILASIYKNVISSHRIDIAYKDACIKSLVLVSRHRCFWANLKGQMGAKPQTTIRVEVREYLWWLGKFFAEKLIEGYDTSHIFDSVVRQLTRGIPSLVPVPKKMISDWPLGAWILVSASAISNKKKKRSNDTFKLKNTKLLRLDTKKFIWF